MAFGQDFLKAFFGNDYLRDYGHASKVFRSNGYENSPRFKFLFHVYFNLNTAQLPALRNVISTSEQSTVGLLVKSVELPKFRFDTDILNQYNRKRVVQKRINYEPVTIKFHDDGGDLVRTLWYNYYAYYYKDPNQNYNALSSTNGSIGASSISTTGFDYNSRDIYSPDRFVNDWGYIGEAYRDGTNSEGGKPQFFKDITIYGFDQHKFVQYTMINPVITQYNHDTYDYSQDNGTMENSMTIQYETVKYYTGALGGVRPATNVPGFASPEYYDQQKSPLSRPGGTRSILGQGGLLDAGIGIIDDLQSGSVMGVIGAIQKAGTVYQTTRNTQLGDIFKEEALGAVKGVIRSTQTGGPGPIWNGAITPFANNKNIFPTPPRRG